LLSNAIKYAEQGHIRIAVDAAAEGRIPASVGGRRRVGIALGTRISFLIASSAASAAGPGLAA
jgi:signal transduction histidine kinase